MLDSARSQAGKSVVVEAWSDVSGGALMPRGVGFGDWRLDVECGGVLLFFMVFLRKVTSGGYKRQNQTAWAAAVQDVRMYTSP